MHNGVNKIDKLDYDDANPRNPLLSDAASASSARPPSQATSHAGEFFEHVAEGIQEMDRQRFNKQLVRYFSFVWAIISCLCGGSITAFSLYGHLFQSRLHYTQAQVNIVSIVAELSLYLPVPIIGLLVDRYGPGPSSLLSGFLFGGGYFLGAFAYNSGPPVASGGEGWPFLVMVIAFIGVGSGTVCMYLPAVTTCAKNFGRGEHKGFALAAPIAAFGLGGMWQSQVGSRLIYEKNGDGSRGDVDVFRYFLFLGGLLLGVGVIGTYALRVVGEDEMIDEAVEQLEQSGLLEDSDFFRRRASGNGYGTMADTDSVDDERLKRRLEEEQRKKTWLLNEETRRFFSDRTMWWLAAGFFLVTGPGEAFINNLGTIIGTLYPDPSSGDVDSTQQPTSPATHVSIVAITSTVARVFAGTLSDLLAPVYERHQHRRGPDSLMSSMASLDTHSHPPQAFWRRHVSVSRVIFLLIFTLLLSLGQVILASGYIQGHGHSRFWIVSALIGTGYGAGFSLVPIIISCVWGVENFGTNWGIVAVVPAGGAALWGVIYAMVYEAAAQASSPDDDVVGGDKRCYGASCYQSTFWGMAISVWIACALWVWAWRGPGGWRQRGILV